MTRPAVRTAARRPGAGVAIDSVRLVRMRIVRRLSRADVALKMSNGPCAICDHPYSHRPDCPNASQFTITPDAIAKIENGHRRPKTATFGRLCDALGCEPEDLLLELSGTPRPCEDCRGVYAHESGCRYAT